MPFAPPPSRRRGCPMQASSTAPIKKSAASQPHKMRSASLLFFQFVSKTPHHL